MIESLGSLKPQISPKAFVHDSAVVIGDVIIEEYANVWPCAVLRGDIERITVKRNASIQDGAFIHTDPGFPTVIGEGTTIAHGCVIHGCRIGDHSLVAMGAIVLTGAEVGEHCIIGAGGLVTEGKGIPSKTIAMGLPVKILRDVTQDDIARIEMTASAYLELVKKYRK
jgi:carbonic anhydrase/acetyltransferase-like protein (isoleucine patch superfamily)